MKGFEPAAGLVAERIRAVGQTRGFALTRVLTHWPEIVGEDIARMARPIKLGHAARRGEAALGATLSLLVSPGFAPVVQMQIPRIIARVNACYGHAAIARVTLTQTAASGFAEGRSAFSRAPAAAPQAAPKPEVAARAAEVSCDVRDDALRAALATLAAHVIERAQKP